MRFLRVLRMQLRRAVVNPFFLMTLVMFTAVLYINSIPARDSVKAASVVYSVESNISAADVLVISILPSLAFALSCQSERREGALRFYFIRAGAAEYVLAKFIASALSGFCTVFFGYAILIAGLSAFYPISCASFSHVQTSFSVFCSQGKYFLYMLCFVFSYSLSGALFSGLAMWFSVYIKERYAAVIMPYLLYMLILFVFETLGVPYAFYPWGWMLSYMDVGNAFSSILIKFIIVAALLTAAAFDTVRRSERSALNE